MKNNDFIYSNKQAFVAIIILIVMNVLLSIMCNSAMNKLNNYRKRCNDLELVIDRSGAFIEDDDVENY